MKKLAQVTTHRVKDNGQSELQPTSFVWDGTGRLRTTQFPDGTTLETRYRKGGLLDTFRTRKGQLKTVTTYDARGREVAHTWNDGTPGVTRQWDDAGRVSWLQNKYARIDYTYDQAGQVLTESNAIAGSNGQTGAASASVAMTSTYTRYPNGEVKTLTYPSGTTVTRAYTARGQTESVTWPDGSVNYKYLADGKVDWSDYGNGLRNNVDYDGRGFPNLTQTYKTAGNVNYTRRTYWRDTRDRITAWVKDEDGRGDRYGYDAEGQLTSAVYNALSPQTTATQPARTDKFIYDALGNRVGKNHVASRGDMTFVRRDNGLNHYLSWENNHPNPPLHWGSGIFYDDNFPGTTWVPPGNGVTMADGLITVSYNALNQPVGAYSPALVPAPYLFFGFDPVGRCVKRWGGTSEAANTNPATYYSYDGWNLIQEGVNATAPNRVYVQGGRRDEIVASGVWSGNLWAYHHYDARGHCILLTRPNRDIIEQVAYDAFGQPYFRGPTGTAVPKVNGRPASLWGNRFLFTGREWLSELGVYDIRNRLYQPELGRFLQPDPMGLQMAGAKPFATSAAFGELPKTFSDNEFNLYRYCHNDPVNKTDPTGLWSEEAHDALLQHRVRVGPGWRVGAGWGHVFAFNI